VHLAKLPAAAASRDEVLEKGMEGVRRLSNLGRAAREQIRIRVRQPLGTLHAVVPDGVVLEAELIEILCDELNVRQVAFIEGADELVTFSAKPNFRALGARFGKETPRIADAVRALSSGALGASRRGAPLEVEHNGERHTILEGELDIIQEASGDFIVEAEGGYTVALDPTITPELRSEGYAREVVSRVQRLRKESGLDVSDRIRLSLAASQELEVIFGEHRDFIMSETLALELEIGAGSQQHTTVRAVDLEGDEVVIGLSRATRTEVG
jgi:isoleucyl-tRNA synthetase